METLDTLPLHPDRPERPFHFEVVLSPYPARGPAAFVVLLWKEDGSPPPVAPPPRDPELSVDLFDFIGALNGRIQGPAGGRAIEGIVNELLRQRYQEGDDDPRSPGEVFGPLADTIPVFAPKSYFGNLGAGSGAVELAASALALRAGRLPRTLNYETPDPACGLAVTRNDTTPPGRAFLNLSVTPQGQAAVLCLAAVD